MVHRNWQNRVEKTEARRNEAKEKKHRTEEKRLFKSMSFELLALFEKNSLNIYKTNVKVMTRKNKKEKEKEKGEHKEDKQGGATITDAVKVHIWIDSMPSDAPTPFIDNIANGNNHDDHHADANNNADSSMDHLSVRQQKKLLQNQHKQAYSHKHNKKKVHPRSKDKDNNHKDGDAELLELSNHNNGANKTTNLPPLLCRSHFFTGSSPTTSGGSSHKKGGGKKKGSGANNSGYPFVQYPKQYRTLKEVLMSSSESGAGSGVGGGNHQQAQRSLKMSEVALLSRHNKNIDNDDIVAATEPNNTISSSSNNNHNDTISNAMDMLYYISVTIFPADDHNNHKNNEDDNDNDDDDSNNNRNNIQNLNEVIMKALSSRDVTIGSMVYVSINNVLVFDRYRDGIIVSESEFLLSATIQIDHNKSTNNHSNDIFLPGILLDKILTFLTDTDVTKMKSICKSWNKEIGETSIFLWQYLLVRNKWPIPTTATTLLSSLVSPSSQIVLSPSSLSNNSNHKELAAKEERKNIQLFRSAFVSHYVAFRDTKSIANGINQIITPPPSSNHHHKNHHHHLSTQTIVEEKRNKKELCFQSFSSSNNNHHHKVSSSSNNNNNSCVSIQVWAKDKILAAYSNDCSVRLFHSISRITSSSDGHSQQLQQQEKTLVCKEIVHYKLDPYQNTKRYTCKLIAMCLDDEYIACLCYSMTSPSSSVENNNNNNNYRNRKKEYMINISTRDQFLLGDDNDTKDDNYYNGNNNKNNNGDDDNNNIDTHGIMKLINIKNSVLSYLLKLSEDIKKIQSNFQIEGDYSGDSNNNNHDNIGYNNFVGYNDPSLLYLVNLLVINNNNDINNNNNNNNNNNDTIEVIASPSIAVCGSNRGNFMVEVSVSAPLPVVSENNDDDESNYGDDTIMTLLLRKIFVFSAISGDVLWMGKSCCNPAVIHNSVETTQQQPPTTEGGQQQQQLFISPVQQEDDVIIATAVKKTAAATTTKKEYHYAAVSSLSPFIVYGSIINAATTTTATTKKKQEQEQEQVEASMLPSTLIARNEIVVSPTHGNAEWEEIFRSKRKGRPVILLESDIVIAESFVRIYRRENGNDDEMTPKEFKSYISFYNISNNDNSNSNKTNDDKIEDEIHLSSSLLSPASVEEGAQGENPSASLSSSASAHTLYPLEGNIKILNLTNLRDDHIIVVCQVYTTILESPPGPDEEEILHPGANWFGIGEIEVQKISIFGILIHVPSRKEIDRVCFIEDLDHHDLLNHNNNNNDYVLQHLVTIIAKGGTAAAGISWKGIVMTGQNIRAVVSGSDDSHNKTKAFANNGGGNIGNHTKDYVEGNDNNDHALLLSSSPTNNKNTKNKKKKKTPRQKKQNKKDGFARGMSLRG